SPRPGMRPMTGCGKRAKLVPLIVETAPPAQPEPPPLRLDDLSPWPRPADCPWTSSCWQWTESPGDAARGGVASGSVSPTGGRPARGDFLTLGEDSSMLPRACRSEPRYAVGLAPSRSKMGHSPGLRLWPRTFWARDGHPLPQRRQDLDRAAQRRRGRGFNARRADGPAGHGLLGGARRDDRLGRPKCRIANVDLFVKQYIHDLLPLQPVLPRF